MTSDSVRVCQKNKRIKKYVSINHVKAGTFLLEIKTYIVHNIRIITRVGYKIRLTANLRFATLLQVG
jgi:hypothetical protein